jgi:EAL domain-containing protein (putative c-di-GMP-specific phosphodiesterase class I)
LQVIAEGVETEERRGFLTRIGCHAFQVTFSADRVLWTNSS